MSRRPLVRRALAAIAMLACAPLVARAELRAGDAAGAARELGVRLARAGRCRAALPELDAARASAPADAEVALLAGQCRMRLQRYDAAARDLAAAAELAPERADVWLALAKARYHARDPDAAWRALARVRRDPERDAEVALYTGLIQLERGEPAAAARSLERARALDPERVEPIASRYLERAREDLERTRARHVWIAVGAGFEHDSNVVLRGGGVPLPDDISGEDDQRGVWTANGGAELWKDEALVVGAMASYRGTTHDELHAFDSHFPSVTAWAELELAEATRAGARYDFGYAWLEGDPFVATNSGRVSLARAFAGWGESEVFGRLHVDDYFFESDDVPEACAVGVVCGPPGVDESRERERSGWGVEAGWIHTLPLPAALGGPLSLDAPRLSGGYRYGYFDARGTEYSYRAHELLLGLETGLVFALDLEANASFAYRPYLHPTTYGDPPLPADGEPYPLSDTRRREKTWQVETVLSRPLAEGLLISGRWRFVDNDSTASVFDYDQHVLGVYLTLGFGREL